MKKNSFFCRWALHFKKLVKWHMNQISPKKKKRRRLKRKRRRSLAPVGIAFFMILCIAGGTTVYAQHEQRVYTRCETEAGTKITAEDFLKDPKYSAEIVSGSIDTSKLGEQRVKIKSGIFTYDCTLTVYDTIAPQASAKNRMSAPGEKLGPEDFAENIKDATKVTAAFVSEPDFSKKGVQKVKVLLTDEGGNETALESELIISPIIESITIEAGGDVPQEKDFYVSGKSESDSIKLVKGLDKVNSRVPGEYPVEFKVGDMTVTSNVIVEDTTAPVLVLKNIHSAYGVLPAAKDFVDKATDMTALTYKYAEGCEPVVQDGEQEVTVIATDAAGNSTQKSAKLTMVEDSEPPVIEGTSDLFAIAGKTVSYRSNVFVTDNVDEDLDFQVITDGVDLNTPGEYKVTYVAEDSAGNRAEKTVKLTVKEMNYTFDDVNQLAQKVAGSIISPAMTDQQKLRAIYNWIRSNISFNNDADKSSWLQAAYQGLTYHEGDCYVFASVSKALLTCAGIQNRDIQMIPQGDYRHYWNLVNIGEGWYHFDTTPRFGGGYDFCYVTDSYLMDYSANNGGSHDYDHSVYTDVVQ